MMGRLHRIDQPWGFGLKPPAGSNSCVTIAAITALLWLFSLIALRGNMVDAAFPFYKMHGIGNDFILADSQDFPPDTDFNALAQGVCDRHFGIGADGLIVRFPAEQAHAQMRIFNSDGSEPEMCGNGLRCFVRYLHEVHHVQADTFDIDTLAGRMRAVYYPENQSVRVDMGEPILAAEKIPALGFAASPVLSQPLSVLDRSFQVSLVSMGNPHCIIFVPDLQAVDFDRLGPALEVHPAFPRKTNVEFVEILSPTHARIRVWERGAGPTLACGTGACAVLVAAVLNGLMAREATLELPGGPLHIHWDETTNHVMMTGPAAQVFQGKFVLEALA
jgi:diaminopimelate epimerase